MSRVVARCITSIARARKCGSGSTCSITSKSKQGAPSSLCNQQPQVAHFSSAATAFEETYDDCVDHAIKSLKRKERLTGGLHNQPTSKHCDTCTCEKHDHGETAEIKKQLHDPEYIRMHEYEHEHEHDHNHVCEDNYIANNYPLPPPLPEPKFSFHRRIMPSSLIQFSSPEGRRLFKEALAQNTSEAFFPLSEQFTNQSEPAYCGVTTLIMVLNAFGIDPNVRWKGGWRWFGSEDMILDKCCVNAERVRRAGILMEEFRSLGGCQGLQIEMKRPLPYKHEDLESAKVDKQYYGLDEFRENIIKMVKNPPVYHTEESHCDKGGGFMVVSFARSALGQTGEGHFSPIAAYHEESDKCLVLDVARFKYAPFWVSINELYESTRPIDPMTNQSRGWFMMYPPPLSSSQEGSYTGTKVLEERKKSADEVPLYEDVVKHHICRNDLPREKRK